MIVPFVGGLSNGRVPDNNTQKCVNWYPQAKDSQDDKSDLIYIGCAGSSLFSDLRSDYSSPCRGLYYTSTGRLFAVFGSALVEVEDDGTYTERFTLSVQATNISFADNGYYMLFVDGLKMYYLKLDNNNTGDVSLDFDNPTQIIFYEQRFFAINRDTETREGVDQVPQNNKFYWSDLGPDGAISWPALNFASTDLSADPIKGISLASGNIWLVGSQSYEVWTGVNDPDLPVNRFGGSASNIGTNAPDSIAEINDRICWLGSSRSGFNQVYVSNGYGAEKISNHAIEYQIGQMNGTSDAVGFCYQQEGHTFYVLTFATGNKTFVYDFTNGFWHERTSSDGVGNTDRWNVRFVAQTATRLVFGNTFDSVLLELDLDKYDEWNGNPIKREARGPVLHNGSNRAFHQMFILDVETGTGLPNDPHPLTYPVQSVSGSNITLTGNFMGSLVVGDDCQIQGSASNDGYYTILSLTLNSGSTIVEVDATLTTSGQDGTFNEVKPLDPKVILKYSDDNHNFTHNSERSIGQIGNYGGRVSWAFLGNSRYRVYCIEFSDPCKCDILGAYADVGGGVK